MADGQTETFARNLARLAATGYSIDDLVRGHRVLAERQRRIDKYLELRGVKPDGRPPMVNPAKAAARFLLAPWRP